MLKSDGTPEGHIPVLCDAVLKGLNVRPGVRMIDGTLGGGGHAKAILQASAPDGRLLGFDRDAAALERVHLRLACVGFRLHTVHASYTEMGLLAPRLGFDAVDGILLDLGYSSFQIDDPSRGFSVRRDGPLDMRFDTRQGKSAADLVNRLPEDELARLIARYGEERHARRIAHAIVDTRPIKTTAGLAKLVEQAKPRNSKERIHPATRTFQALRIAVNDELGMLERVLPQTVNLLKSGGRLAVISFHSLEDRIVKRFMRREASDCVCPPDQPICTCDHWATLKTITRKPVVATDEEIAHNPRARSAKLRVAERL